MGVRESDIIGDSRVQVYVRPRAAIVWIAKLLTDHSLAQIGRALGGRDHRSEEHTSELQSLMRISYAVFCLKTKQKRPTIVRPSTATTLTTHIRTITTSS